MFRVLNRLTGFSVVVFAILQKNKESAPYLRYDKNRKYRAIALSYDYYVCCVSNASKLESEKVGCGIFTRRVAYNVSVEPRLNLCTCVIISTCTETKADVLTKLVSENAPYIPEF